MRKLSPLSDLLRHIFFLWAIVLISETMSASVLNTQPVSGCTLCDGSALLTLSQIGIADVVWLDPDGNIVFEDFNVSGSSSITGLCIGQYSVQILQDGVEIESLDFAVSISGVSAGISAEGFACAGGSSINMFDLLGAGVTPGGIWTNSQGDVVTATFFPGTSLPGQYTYTVLNAGCSVSSTVTMTVNQSADPGISTTYLICENYLTFQLVSALFGQPDPGGIWFGPNFDFDDGLYNPETDDSGIFTYMIDTVPGCPAVFSTLFVVENQIPDSGIDAEISVCPTAVPFNMIDYLGGTPQPGGQWFYNMIQPVGPVFNPATSQPGVYRYQVNGNTPCPNTFSFLTITFTDGISAGDDNAADFCVSDGETNMLMLLNGQPDAGGLWTGPDGVVADGIFIPAVMPSGNYIYTVDALGCQPVSAALNLTVESLPYAGEDVYVQMCQNMQPVDLTAFPAGNSQPGIFFQNGAALANPSLELQPGNFSFQFVVTGNVCPDDDAMIHVQVDQPLEDLGMAAAAICSTQEFFDLNEFSDDYGLTGIWKNQTGQIVPSGLASPVGSEEWYYFVVSSGNTCPNDSLAAVISVFEPVFESQVIELSFCETSPEFDLESQLTADELTNGQWQSDSNPLFVPSVGTYQYFFNGIQNMANPCPAAVIEFNIEVDQAPWAGDDSELTVCANLGLIDLNDFLSFGSTAGGIWSQEGVEVVPLVQANGLDGVEFIYLTAPSGACPADLSTHLFTVDFGIAFNPGPDLEVCPGFEPVQLGDIPQSGYNYFWFPDDRLDNPFSSQPFISLENPENEEVNINYSVLVTNGICTFNEDLEVLIHPLPTPDLGPDLTICQGQTVEIQATGGATYDWFVNSATVTDGISLSMELFENTEIHVLAYSTFGCTNTDSVIVTVLPVPEALFEVFPYEGCSPLPVTVTNLSNNVMPVTYQWLVNDVLVSTAPEAEIWLSDPDVYDFVLVITADNGCSATQTAEGLVTVFGQPTAFFTFDPYYPDILHTQVTFNNQSTGFISMDWTVDGSSAGDSFSLVYDFPEWENVDYEVCLQVSNEFGCSADYCETILIEGVPAVYVPNAFTPDGNGQNDVFIPVMTGMSDAGYELAIYNRWGEKIFVSDNPDAAWTGNAFGGDFYVQNEVYTWVLKCREMKTGLNRVFNGFVTIIR